MLLDKLTTINRFTLKFAQAVAPIKQVNVTSFEQVDFEISHPKADAILDFEISNAKVSSDYSLSNYSNILYQVGILQSLTVGNEIELLNNPGVYSVTEINELLSPQVKIENIEFHFAKTLIKGKNYVSKTENSKHTLFSDVDKEDDAFHKKNKPKIKRQYTKENEQEPFDIFDLIFPALQPPLGDTFNNSISFPHPLYPFQVEGIKFLHTSTSALLGDEMGLGKSIQTIVAARFLFRQGGISSACIICPKAVLTDWEKKIWDWAPELKVIKIVGDKSNRESLWKSQAHFFICTYETLLSDLKHTSAIRGLEINEKGHIIRCPGIQCGKKVNFPYTHHYTTGSCPYCNQLISHPANGDIAKTYFDLLVFDEIQKTKNPQAKITKSSRTLWAKYKWALTGTPLENKIEDLVSICETIKPHLFDGVHIKDNRNVIETYKPIFKRRRKDDVLKQLPPKITEEIWLDLLPSQREKYDLAETQGKIDLEGTGEELTIQHIFALITKLKQICNYDPESHESVKLDYLKEKLEELAPQGDKALVFSQYPNETLKRILPHLKEYNPTIYDGSLSDLKRTAIINDFQTSDNSKLMLLSIKAGNAGITLTKANYVYHFDLLWNPAISAQAVGRAHRIGQEKTVWETYLLAENTVERRIHNILAGKKMLFNEIVDGLSDTNFLTQSMTEDEIFGLFGLKKQRAKANSSRVKKSKDFHSLNPYEFEDFVGDLFMQMGYSSRVTKKSNDGGVDIFAKLQTPIGIDEIIIQCKHKENPTSTVAVDKVRELFGVLSSDRKLSKGFLITNGKFTSGAYDFAKGKHIELVDGTRLQGYVDIYY